jgi:CheY-like chemotaxis protein
VILGCIEAMNLSSLLICADEAPVEVLTRVLEELSIQVELCDDAARGFLRLAQDRFDLVILDCEVQPDVLTLLQQSSASRLDDSTLGLAIVSGQESIRELFSLGVNFVLYKPVTYEGALSSLRAAQNALFRDKRQKARAAVHTHAVIDYAGVEQARATLVDLAEDGMAVNFGKKVPPSCKVYFQFQLPGQTASVRLSGHVVWQDWNGRAGIQFVDVPQASRRVLREWLKMNLADAPRQQLESEMVEVEHSTRANADEGLVHSGGKKQDLGKSSLTKQESNVSDRDAVARLRSEPSNRRGETRYACRLGAEVYQKGSTVRNFCHLSDLSAGGCYLEMPLAFAAGSPVEIVVRTHQMKLKLTGEVKSSHPGYGMGVLFHLNTRDERQGVQQLIDFVAAAAEASN